MYGLANTHKVNDLVRIIASGCNTAYENLPIFVEKVYIKKLKEFYLELKTPTKC